MTHQFDTIVERRHTHSLKWDFGQERFGRADILPMWVADMDFLSSDAIIKAINKRTQHGIFGYTNANDELASALKDWGKRRHNYSIEKNWVITSPGVVTSVTMALLAFTKEQDKVLLQTPIYYPFYDCIQQHNRELVRNPLKQLKNGRYDIDFDDLKQKLSSGVKLMILCSPHNPIGRVWSKEDLLKIMLLCKQYQVLLLSDEIHCDLVFSDVTQTSLLAFNESDIQNIIVLNSPTKTFNIAGLSVSNVIIPNSHLRDSFAHALHKYGADNINILGVEAAIAAYRLGDEWLDALLRYLEENLAFLERYIEDELPVIKLIKPEATYLAWLDFNALPIAAEDIKPFLVEKAGVGLNEGTTFGPEGIGYQRLNFACPRKTLVEGLEKIKQAVKGLD